MRIYSRCSKHPPEEGGLHSSGRVEISTIDMKEFRPVDGCPDKKPCIVCGRKPTHFQERAKEKKGAVLEIN